MDQQEQDTSPQDKHKLLFLENRVMMVLCICASAFFLFFGITQLAGAYSTQNPAVFIILFFIYKEIQIEIECCNQLIVNTHRTTLFFAQK